MNNDDDLDVDDDEHVEDDEDQDEVEKVSAQCAARRATAAGNTVLDGMLGAIIKKHAGFKPTAWMKAGTPSAICKSKKPSKRKGAGAAADEDAASELPLALALGGADSEQVPSNLPLGGDVLVDADKAPSNDVPVDADEAENTTDSSLPVVAPASK